MTTKSTKSRIPSFANYKEEAAFWDTHDTADYADEFRPVKARFAKNLSQALSIRLDSRTIDSLRAQAARKGVGPTTLARMWILERLETITPKKPSAKRSSRARKAS